MNWPGGIKLVLPLAVVVFCLFEFALHRHSGMVREWVAAFLSLQSLVVGCLAIWCAAFLWLSFHRLDWFLIGCLACGLVWWLAGESKSSTQCLILLFGAVLGEGTQFLLKSGERKSAFAELRRDRAESGSFLLGLVILLALASWWHLDMSGNYYSGPRWMGLWDNPNTYGMLMGAGAVLAVGLLTRMKKEECRMKKQGKAESGESGKRKLLAVVKLAIRQPQSSILMLAAGMMGVGLVMSYSRGAWLATGIGLTYLAWCYGKLRWRHLKLFLLFAFCFPLLVVCLLWGRTPDHAPWYVKRADLGRPSAQNRATAWRAGLEIMREHPLGVGWNKAVSLYGEKYRPPEGGPAALTTNDYLMLGTELGIPALLCFVAYVGLCYRKSPRIHLTPALSPFGPSAPAKRGEGELLSVTQQAMSLDTSHASLRAACLAGALVLVVAFWFDGGLFKLPTAAMFWVLLELGAYRAPKS